MPAPTACRQHPSVQTRLRCSSCEAPICPQCAREAAVGYKCPACARQDDATTTPRTQSGSRALERFSGSVNRRARGGSTGDGGAASGERLGVSVAARAVAIGAAAAVLGGLVLAPVLQGGFLFLLSSGAVGWGVARAVYWGSQERDSALVRAVALTLAGFTVAIALAVAGFPTAPPGLTFLAYPAAVYGSWIVVRGR